MAAIPWYLIAVPWLLAAAALVVLVLIVIQHVKHIRPLEKKYDAMRRRQLLWQRGFFALWPVMGVLYAINPGKGIWLIEDALPLNFIILVGIPAIWLTALALIINMKYPKSKH